jgi:lipopolysaccharide export system permease protein
VGLPPPAPAAADSLPLAAPSGFCRVWSWIGSLLLPDTLQAQTLGRLKTDSGPRPALERIAPRARPAVLSAGGALPEEARIRAARQRAAAYLVEIHKKLAIAAACLVFTLVGIPVALRFPRGGIGLVIGVSLAVFTIYYVGLIGGEELGDRLIVTPFISMWVPNLVFSAVGLLGLWSLRREGWSARGGGWAELRDLFRPPRRRRRA